MESFKTKGGVMVNKSKFYRHKQKGIEKRTYNGITFDSELEMKYYRDVLLPMQEAGTIKYIKRQPEYLLQDKVEHFDRKYSRIIYKADFEVVTAGSSKKIAIDVKGTYGYNIADQVAILKRKLFAAKYPDIKLNWVTYCKKYGGWISWDDYNGYRREEKKAKKIV